MSNTPLRHFDALQSLASVLAGPQTRGAAPSGSPTAAPASASSSATPFAALLSELQALTHPAASSSSAVLPPPASADAPLVEDAAGEAAKANSAGTDASRAVKAGSPSKAAPKSGDTPRGLASRSLSAQPGAAPVIDPTPTAPISQPSLPVTLKLGASQPAPAVEANAPPARQAGPAYTIDSTAPDLAEISAAAGQAGPAANASETALVTLPRSLTASGPASASQAIDPALLAAAPAKGPQVATAAPAANGAAGKASQQVAPALVQLSHAAGGGQLTLQLNPGELGRVHIQIDRAADGSASVHVTADRADTLQLLVADQAQLHHALDSAGLPQDGRTLSLSLAKPEPTAPDGFSGGAGGSLGGGGGSAAGEQSGGQQGRPSSQASSAWGSGDEPGAWGSGIESATRSTTTTTRLRAGVDITA